MPGTPDPMREAASDLVRHISRMLDDWAELSHVPEQQRNRELWTPLHEKAEHLAGLLDAERR